MGKKINLEKFETLSAFEMLVFDIMLRHEKEGVKSTLSDVNFEALPLVSERRISVKDGETTVKALKKIAVPDNKTGEWKLKPSFFE